MGSPADQYRLAGGHLREVAVFAQVGDDAAGIEDLAREWRNGPERDIARGRSQHARRQVERHRVAVPGPLDGMSGLEHRDAEVDAVAEEDAREVLRDDAADPQFRERGDRVLARRPAAEVLATDQDVPGPDLLRESGTRIAEGVG